MIVFERFLKGTWFVPKKAEPDGGGFRAAEPSLTPDERAVTKSLIMIQSDEELLYYLQRGYSVRMVGEDSADGHFAKAEDIAVRVVPPYS